MYTENGSMCIVFLLAVFSLGALSRLGFDMPQGSENGICDILLLQMRRVAVLQIFQQRSVQYELSSRHPMPLSVEIDT
jgi:hypothetical protein